MPSGKPLYNQDGTINESVASMFKKAKSLSSNAAKWALSGFPKSTEDQLAERMSICTSCEFWDKSGFSGTGKCTKCGCSTAAKLRMATSKCPIDKW